MEKAPPLPHDPVLQAFFDLQNASLMDEFERIIIPMHFRGRFYIFAIEEGVRGALLLTLLTEITQEEAYIRQDQAIAIRDFTEFLRRDQTIHLHSDRDGNTFASLTIGDFPLGGGYYYFQVQ